MTFSNQYGDVASPENIHCIFNDEFTDETFIWELFWSSEGDTSNHELI